MCFKMSARCYPHVISDNLVFEQVSTEKILGVTFKQDLKWNDHINNTTAKAEKRLYLLRELRRAGVGCNDLFFYFVVAQ